jgi:hypothetical protein
MEARKSFAMDPRYNQTVTSAELVKTALVLIKKLGVLTVGGGAIGRGH